VASDALLIASTGLGWSTRVEGQGKFVF